SIQKPVDALDLLEADWRRATVLYDGGRHPAGGIPARRRVRPGLCDAQRRGYGVRAEARAARRAGAGASRARGRAREAVLALEHAAHGLHARGVAHALEALLLGLAIGLPGMTAIGAAGAAAVMGLNWEFLTAIRRSDGWIRMLAAIPVLWLELLVVGTGTAVGLVSYPFGRRY